VLQSPHQVRADIALQVAAPYRKYKDHIARAQMAALEPGDKDRLPALVVDPRRQLRYIIGGAVGLDPGDFTKVVHAVPSVGRAAAHTQEKEPSAALAQCYKHFHDALDGGTIKLIDNCTCFSQVLGCKGHALLLQRLPPPALLFPGGWALQTAPFLTASFPR